MNTNELIKQKLNNSDEQIRIDAIYELENNNAIEEAIPLLLEILENKEETFEMKYTVLEVLDTLENKETLIKPLINILNDESYQLRGLASKILGDIGKPSIIPNLINLLNHKEYQVSFLTIEALGKFKTPETIFALSQFAFNDKNNKYLREEAQSLIMKMMSQTEKSSDDLIATESIAQLLEEAQSVSVNEQKTPPSHLERFLNILKTKTKRVSDFVETASDIDVYVAIDYVKTLFNINHLQPAGSSLGDETLEQQLTSSQISIDNQDYQLKIKVDNDTYQFSLSHAEKGYVVPESIKLSVTTSLNQETKEYEAQHSDGLLTLSIPLKEYDEVIWETQPLPDNLN